MAINKNHEFEDLNGIKCAVVEKNATAERIAFLKPLLEMNGFTVVVVPSPPPKVVPAPASAEATAGKPKPVEGDVPAVSEVMEDKIETSTIGVTDVTFNTTNAIFGRLLKTNNGHIVTLDYWQQKENVSSDTIPYFANDENIQSWK